MSMSAPPAFPEYFRDEEELDELMTRPQQILIEELATLDDGIIVLGASGKIGPTLARLAKRAAPAKRVIAVARFQDEKNPQRRYLESHGVETLACDFLDGDAVTRLPEVKNVIYMAGLSSRKFGPAGVDPMVWAMNVHVPALISRRFAGSRIVCFSTGCVYPFVPVIGGGAVERTYLAPPPSEYANSCIGRERIFEFYSNELKTECCIFRLNYAIDMRYGILHDLATKIMAGASIDVTTGNVNVIWQGDAASMALRSLRHCSSPASVFNVSGPETVSIRYVAEQLAARLGKIARLEGREAAECWLVNSALAMKTFGYPSTPLLTLVDWTANWVMREMPSLSKATYYDLRPRAQAAEFT